MKRKKRDRKRDEAFQHACVHALVAWFDIHGIPPMHALQAMANTMVIIIKQRVRGTPHMQEISPNDLRKAEIIAAELCCDMIRETLEANP